VYIAKAVKNQSLLESASAYIVALMYDGLFPTQG
jgi:hypothetical protein